MCGFHFFPSSLSYSFYCYFFYSYYPSSPLSFLSDPLLPPSPILLPCPPSPADSTPPCPPCPRPSAASHDHHHYHGPKRQILVSISLQAATPGRNLSHVSRNIRVSDLPRLTGDRTKLRCTIQGNSALKGLRGLITVLMRGGEWL